MEKRRLQGFTKKISSLSISVFHCRVSLLFFRFPENRVSDYQEEKGLERITRKPTLKKLILG